MNTKTQTTNQLRGVWTWLFPLTYILHIAEEYWCGETFYRWISRLGAVDFRAEEFLRLNFIALGLMILIVAMVNKFPSLQWWMATLGFIVTFNGSAHTIASLVTRTYSPGLVSGLLIWVPLGLRTIFLAWRTLPRRWFAIGIGAGVLGHALVSFLAFRG